MMWCSDVSSFLLTPAIQMTDFTTNIHCFILIVSCYLLNCHIPRSASSTSSHPSHSLAGSHKGTSFTPVAWKVPDEPKETYFICTCKKTSKAPFCDGK